MLSRSLVVALAVALALALAGAACSRSEAQPAEPEPAAVETRPQATTVTVEVEAESDAREVAIRVASGSWGVFAFADVYIDGKGPFNFTVDTGASSSIIDWDLARKLGIKTIGPPLTVTGITCRGEASKIKVSDWRIGDVVLPAKRIQTIDMPDPGGGVDGLLGSDVLSTFGAITVDYGGQRLLLASDS